MDLLKGKKCYLRALEKEDIDFLFQVENNEQFWEISNTQFPFSRTLLTNYLENAHQDIYVAKQYRFVIAQSNGEPVGLIDLFDFSPQHHRVHVGIVILDGSQKKGYGKEAIHLICNHAFNYLQVHQVVASVSADNQKSIKLFEKLQFTSTSIKRDWLYTKTGYKDVLVYQLFKNQYAKIL